MATGLEKVSFHSNPKERQCKECSIYHTIALISHVSKVIHRILLSRLQKYKKQELPDEQAEFRKGRGTRDQIANMHWITEKVREFQKNMYLCFIDYTKAFTVWITTKCGTALKRWEYQTPDLPPEKSVWRPRSNS